MGATDVVGGGTLPTDKGYYTVEDLTHLRKRIEEAGPEAVDHQRAARGIDLQNQTGATGPGRADRQLCKTLRNMGQSGIPTLIYFFSLRSWYGNYGLRTDRATPGRGGSALTSFDYDAVKHETEEYWYSPVPKSVVAGDEQIWDNVIYFLKVVIPVAEEAGVQMALHPDDPPISPIARSPEYSAVTRRCSDSSRSCRATPTA